MEHQKGENKEYDEELINWKSQNVISNKEKMGWRGLFNTDGRGHCCFPECGFRT